MMTASEQPTVPCRGYFGRKIGKFREQNILMHSVIYRLRDSRLRHRLPKHTFYVDNVTCTRNMPLWPDKAAMLLTLGALGIGYGFRGWYLYYNDRDQ